MNLTKKMWIALAFLVLFAAMTPTALAASEDLPDDGSEESSSFWEDVKGAGSEVWQSAKEHAPGWWESIKGAFSTAKDTVKEHGPGWVEAAQEKGSELLDKGADALQNAGEQVSEFLDDQQNQFWERTEQQIYGGSSSNSTASPDSAAPGSVPDASSPPEDSAPAGSPPAGSGSAPDSVGSDPDEAGSAAGDATADGSAPPDTASADSEAGSAPAQNDAAPEYNPGHRIVADEDTTNVEGAGPTEDAEAAPGPSLTFVWVAVPLGLAAVACGSLYMLRKR